MRRELLLLEEMIDAAEQAHLLAADQTAESLASDVSGVTPCSGTSPFSARPPPQLPDDSRADCPEIPWQEPPRLRNRIVHGYWSIDLDILITTAAEHLPAMADQLRSLHRALDQPQEITNGPEPGAEV